MDTTLTSGNLQSLLRLFDAKGVSPKRMTKVLASGILADVFDRRADLSKRDSIRTALGLSFYIIKPFEFDPAAVFGKGWSVWRGPMDGDGLTGDIERDERAYALKELDLALVKLTVILRGERCESYTTGLEQVTRIKEAMPEHIRLDPRFAFTFVSRRGSLQYPNAWEGKAVFWDGLVVRGPDGRRYTLFSTYSKGDVTIRCERLDKGRDERCPSALLASNHVAVAS